MPKTATVAGSKRKHSALDPDPTEPSHPPMRVKIETNESTALGSATIDANAVDEDGIPLVIDPTEDIMDDLHDAFGMDLEFKGTFAYSKTYKDAPNPALRVDGLGTVGLPLGDGPTVAAFSQLCGAGDNANVSTLDAACAQFDNPAWATWIDYVRRDACNALGTGDAGSTTRAVLQRVILHRSGARPLSTAITNHAPNAFGLMAVTLPARFVGGSTKLTYQRQTVDVDVSQGSLLCTSVVAWYNGVEVQSDSITSGYSFVLLYDLVQPSESALSAIVPPSEPLAITKLRHVLLSWKQSPDAHPQKIVFMLDKDLYDYNLKPELSAARLQGDRDAARLLRVLDDLAQELGFCLGLSTLSYVVSGTPKGSGYMGRWERALDEDNFETEMIEGSGNEHESYLGRLLDVDGKEILDDPEWDEDEVLPIGWKDDLDESDDHDAEMICEDELHYTYSRTAIVMWPRSRTFANGLGDRRVLHALRGLRTVSLPEAGHSPSREDEGNFDSVLATSDIAHDEALAVLCAAARQWRKLDLWKRAVSSNRGYVTADEAYSAIQLFGLDAVRQSIEQLVDGDTKNHTRFAFLDELTAVATATASSNEQQVVAAFVQSCRVRALSDLKELCQEDMTALTREALKQGGALYLRDVLKPQILGVAPLKFMLDYATWLHSVGEELVDTEEDDSRILDVITSLLYTVANRTDFFAPLQTQVTHFSTVTRTRPSPQPAYDFITKCFDLGNDHIVPSILKALADTTGLSAAVVRSRASTVLLPLIPMLRRFIESKQPRPRWPVRDLCTVALTHAVEDSSCRDTAFINAVLDAVVLAGDPPILATLALPRLKNVLNGGHDQYLIKELDRRKADGAFSAAARPMVNSAVRQLALSYAQTESLPRSFEYPSSSRLDYVMPVLELCYLHGGDEGLSVLLSRILYLNWTSGSVATGLAGQLTTKLRSLAGTSARSVSQEPFASALRCILRKWMQQILAYGHSIRGADVVLQLLAQHACTTPCHCVHRYWTESIQYRHVPKQETIYQLTPTGRVKKNGNHRLHTPSPNDNWRSSLGQGSHLIAGMAEKEELPRIFGAAFVHITTLFPSVA